MKTASLYFFVLTATVLAAEKANPTVIDLWPEGVPGLRADATPQKLENARISNVHRPTMTYFPAPPATATGTAVIICPGGGYVRLSVENEGSLVAQRFNQMGVAAFVLYYRLQEYGHPAPLRDVLRAIRLVRSRASDFDLKSDQIGVIGFSAGGHVAACASTMFDSPDGRTGAALDAISARPDFSILVYPVITLKSPSGHAGSRQALLGAAASAELVATMSAETRVTKATPPTFLVHTQNDRTVPVENALSYYLALRNAGVPVEMHLWPDGPHGFGMRADLGPPSTWTLRCEEWMRANKWLK